MTHKFQKREEEQEEGQQPPLLPLTSIYKSSEHSAYDPTYFDTSSVSQNPFTNNWRDYDSSNFYQRQPSNKIFNSNTPSFTSESAQIPSVPYSNSLQPSNQQFIQNFQKIELEKTSKRQDDAKVVELI